MKRIHKIAGIVLSFAIITLIAGCGGSSSSSGTTSGSTPSAKDGTGVVSLSITDAPMWKKLDDRVVTEVNITIIGVEYRHEDNWIKAEDFGEPKMFNLLDLQNGESLHLGEMVLPAGHYTEIRFKLDIPEKEGDVKGNPGCFITFNDDPESTTPLFVPSGGQSGYKGKVEFDLTADAQIEIMADWDASRSVVSAGNSGKYLLKPIIRLVVIERSGTIKGTVVDIDIAKYDDADEAEKSLVVYAYINDENAETNYDTNPDGEELEDFPNAVSLTNVNMDDGNFTLPFLKEGIYDLVTAYYVAGVLDEVDVEENDIDGADINVSNAEETFVDVNTTVNPTP